MEVNSVYIDIELYNELLTKANLYDEIKKGVKCSTDVNIINKADIDKIKESVKIDGMNL